MPRPVILGVVGDSAAGKTTISRGLVRILGEDRVTHVCTDDYHRYDRRQRADLGITPLQPGLQLPRHRRPAPGAPAGGRGDPEARLTVTPTGPSGARLREAARLHDRRGAPRLPHAGHARLLDVRVYLAPPEDLRRKWKVQRDCSRRGYTTDQVLGELDRREPDSAAFIRPQERCADIVVSFSPGESGGDPDFLDAVVALRDGLRHPDLSPFIGNGARAVSVEQRGSERHVHIPGDIDPGRAKEMEEAIWEKLHFATHLRSQRLGEFTVGIDLHRSESLALVQLLILYHLVWRGRRSRSAGTARASPTSRPFRTPERSRSPCGPRRRARRPGTPAPVGAWDRSPAAAGTSAGPEAAGSGRSSSNRPSSSSSRVARRDWTDTPSPARAPCLIAPFEPRVSTRGSRPAVAKISSVIVRVPEPSSSRRSHGRSANSSIGTEGLRASGSPGLVMTTIGLSRNRSPTTPSPAGRLWRHRSDGGARVRARARGYRRRGSP